jgi:iron complex transport system ATP-binding protein
VGDASFANTVSVEATNIFWKPQGKVRLKVSDLKIFSQKITAVIGKNGAGKSSLLRCLSGLEKFSGNVKIAGRAIHDIKVDKRPLLLAHMGDTTAVPFNYSANEIMLMGLYPWHRGYPGKEDQERVTEVAHRLQISGLLPRTVNELSAGERQKIHLGRVLVSKANLLVLDEPLSHMDLNSQFIVLEYLRDLKTSGKTIICALHDLNQAFHYSEDFLCLHSGEFVAHGSVEKDLDLKKLSEVFGVSIKKQSEGQGKFYSVTPRGSIDGYSAPDK